MLKEVREDAVLDAAEAAFTKYGTRRVTMADIAEIVGMSRPALYLYFNGREDILRCVVKRIHASTLDNVRTALTSHGTLKNQVFAALKARDGAFFDRLLECDRASPWFLDKKQAGLAECLTDADEAYFDLLLHRFQLSGMPTERARTMTRLCIATASGLRMISSTRKSFVTHLRASVEQIFEGVTPSLSEHTIPLVESWTS